MLHILLQQLQPYDAAFALPEPGSGSGQGWGGGAHPPEGVPQTVRDEAEVRGARSLARWAAHSLECRNLLAVPMMGRGSWGPH